MATEVVVTAPQRRSLGNALGGIRAEKRLSAEDIQSYGVSSVRELLEDLARETGARSGGVVVLLNGQRLSGLNEVRDIPTEALARVDILPPQVGRTYGYPANQRVVNLVLKQTSRTRTAELEGGGPTTGGQAEGRAKVDYFDVRADDRVNVALEYRGSSALSEADRGLSPVPPSAPYDLRGNVTAPVVGNELDPALSALAGRALSIAGVPSSARAGRPTLAEFAAAAWLANPGDVSRYRSLLPASEKVSLNAVVSRALPAGLAATFSATLEANSSDAVRGFPTLSLPLPAGSPFSPFTQDVVLHRYLDSQGPLRRSAQGWTAHLGATLNKDIALWKMSVTAAYDHEAGWTGSDTGVEPGLIERAVNVGEANPFGPIAASLVPKSARDEAKLRADAVQADVLVNGPLFRAPAGLAMLSLKLGDGQTWLSSLSRSSGIAQASGISRNTLAGQASLDVPLFGRTTGAFLSLGELSLNANVVAQQLSDFGALNAWGSGATWTPAPSLTITGSIAREEIAPSIQQLGGPTLRTYAVPAFDYARGAAVQVTQLAGGDPGLKAERRTVLKLGLSFRPLAESDLIFTADLRSSRVQNSIRPLLASTADYEAAFPQRFTRDPAGVLVQLDLRPVNFARRREEELTWGFDYARRLGAIKRPSATSSSDGSAGATGRFQLAIFHTILFADTLQARAGGPTLDLLNGAGGGTDGGDPRHQVDADAGYSRSGLGMRLNLHWQSATVVNGGSTSEATMHFSSLTTLNLRLFANLDDQPGLPKSLPWLRGSRLTLSASNLFDQRIQVRDALGRTPLAYQSAYLDPAGRVLRLGFRKVF